jgi:hypothetical protein
MVVAKKPTAKQIAARKLFAQRAKAGTLRTGVRKRAKNPARGGNDAIHIDIDSHNTRGKHVRAKNPVNRGEYLAVMVNAGNSANGNARRGWVVVRIQGGEAEKVTFVDHGYSGEGALREYARDTGKEWPMAQIGEFPISSATYKDLKKSGVSYG